MVSKIHLKNPTLERGRGRKREEREGRLGERSTSGQPRQQKSERQRERGVRGIYGAHAGVQNTLRLKLETKTPVGAKPEIST